jgi:hypothetical protein
MLQILGGAKKLLKTPSARSTESSGIIHAPLEAVRKEKETCLWQKIQFVE